MSSDAASQRRAGGSGPTEPASEGGDGRTSEGSGGPFGYFESWARRMQTREQRDAGAGAGADAGHDEDAPASEPMNRPSSQNHNDHVLSDRAHRPGSRRRGTALQGEEGVGAARSDAGAAPATATADSWQIIGRRLISRVERVDRAAGGGDSVLEYGDDEDEDNEDDDDGRSVEADGGSGGGGRPRDSRPVTISRGVGQGQGDERPARSAPSNGRLTAEMRSAARGRNTGVRAGRGVLDPATGGRSSSGGVGSHAGVGPSTGRDEFGVPSEFRGRLAEMLQLMGHSADAEAAEGGFGSDSDGLDSFVAGSISTEGAMMA